MSVTRHESNANRMEVTAVSAEAAAPAPRETGGCIRCRMLQPTLAACAVCGPEAMLALPREIDRLRRPTIEGVTLREQKPPTGPRDQAELLATAVSTIAAATG